MSGTTFANNTKGETATYYVDQYGFVVHTDSKTTASTDYAYVIAVDGKLSTSFDDKTPSVKAKVALVDGTIATYDVKLTKDDTNKDWYIKGVGATSTNNLTLTNDASVKSDAEGDLKDKVFGYTVDNGVITFETIKALPADGTNAAENTVYVASLGADATSKATSYTVNGKSVLVNNSTLFVAYNTDKAKVTVYTGLDALPKSITAAGFSTANDTAVLKTGTTANTGVASVIFFTMGSALTADDTDKYVYVTNDLQQVVIDGKNKNQFTAYAADGTTSKVIASGTSITAGLYVPN